MNDDRPLLALAYMLAAQFCFSTNILLLRITEQSERAALDPSFHLSPWEAMLCRSLLLSAWCFYKLRQGPVRRLEGKENFWLWARGLSGVLSLSAYYYGVLHIPLGMASLFSNSSPLYITVLAIAFSGETVNRWGALALFGGFAGVGLVAWGAAHGIEGMALSAVLIAALSGPLSATAYFSIRQLKRIRNEQIMMSLGLAGSLLAITALCFKGEHFPRTGLAWFWLLLSSLPAIVAQECLTRAFRAGPASQVAPLQYTGPLFSCVLAWLFLQESIPALALGGIAMVVAFGFCLPYWQAGKKLAALPAEEAAPGKR